jgi:hypothetical protein
MAFVWVLAVSLLSLTASSADIVLFGDSLSDSGESSALAALEMIRTSCWGSTPSHDVDSFTTLDLNLDNLAHKSEIWWGRFRRRWIRLQCQRQVRVEVERGRHTAICQVLSQCFIPATP